MVTFLCHHSQRDFFYIFLFVICHMTFIYVDRNATAVNILQVAIKYTSNLEVRNVRGQIASNFFPGGSYVSITIFLYNSSWILLTFYLMIL